MQIVKKLYLKLFDKNKYHFEKNEDKAKKNLAIYKEKIEKKINDILNDIDKSKVLNFKHSGHCGDIICSLPVVKELAKTRECNFFINVNKKLPSPYFKHPSQKVFVDDRMFYLIKPLLEKQKYINKVAKFNGEKINIDLDLFRDMPINLTFNSCRWFFHVTGIQIDLSEPYIETDKDSKIQNKVVIHRTFRYRNNMINYKFLQNYNDIFFIGLKNEYEDLKKEVKNLNFYECKDFLDMAQIMNSSKMFIGNSSVGFDLAEALKVPRLLEASPDFPVMQITGKNGFDFYYQPHFEKLFNNLYKKYTNT